MKKLATLLVVTLVLTFSVFAPTRSGYAETDIVNMVKEQMAQAGIQVESVKVVGNSSYLTTYNNKATPVQTLTIQIKQHASFEDMLKGSETIEQYLLYLALDNGLTIEESQKMRTPADLLYWLKAHNVDIRKGYSWTWGTDVTVVNGTLMNVYEDGTMLPFKTIIEKKPNASISKENMEFLEIHSTYSK